MPNINVELNGMISLELNSWLPSFLWIEETNHMLITMRKNHAPRPDGITVDILVHH